MDIQSAAVITAADVHQHFHMKRSQKDGHNSLVVAMCVTFPSFFKNHGALVSNSIYLFAFTAQHLCGNSKVQVLHT